MNRRMSLFLRFLSPSLVLLLAPSLWSANASFQTSSLPHNVRIEGLAELAGAVTLTTKTPGETIPANSSLGLAYSAPISATASDDGSNKIVTCTVGGVTGACPPFVTVQVAGKNIFLGFGAALTFPSGGDGLTIDQVRLNVSGLSPGGQATVLLSGGGSFGTLTNPQLTVVNGAFTSLNPSASTLTASSSGVFACAPQGTTAMTFSVSVMEGFAGGFSSVTQEGGTGAATATNGANLEVLLTNVPPGVTVAPANTTGSTASLTFGPLPAAITQSGTGTMLFSFPFTATNTGSVETAVVNFTAGFTNPIPLSALAGTVTARARLGPVSTASVSPPVIVSFVNNTAVSGTPFAVVPCTLALTGGSSIVKFQAAAGTGLTAVSQLEVYEARASAATFTATSSASWLSASPATGVTPLFIAVNFDATNLTPGTYTGQIVVTAVGATSVTIQAQFTVVSPIPTISLNQGTFTFNGLLGASNPPPQSTTISNSGTGAFNWTTSASTVTGGSWLSVSPASGTGAGSITASVNIAGLALGQYTGTIQVASVGASNTPQTISVILTVTSPPTIAPALPLLSFVSAAGANPGPQTLQINNSGGGTLGLTVATSTSSGGTWLTATPSTGTAPLALTVSVAASSLAVGNYQGTITLTATAGSGALNSPQTVGVNLAVGTPAINTGGVVGGASYITNASVTPGSIGTIFGVRLAANTASATTLPLPVILAGTQVFLNGLSGIACPLFYVSPPRLTSRCPWKRRPLPRRLRSFPAVWRDPRRQSHPARYTREFSRSTARVPARRRR